MKQTTKKKYDVAITCFYDMRHAERDYHVWLSLVRKGLKVLLITNFQEAFEHFWKKEVDVVNIDDEKVPECRGTEFEEECRRIQDKYLSGQSLYKFSETNYLQAPAFFSDRDVAVKLAVQRFRKYEALFKKFSIDCVFQQYTADIDRMTLWLVSKDRCDKVYMYTASGLPERETILVSNNSFDVLGLREKFDALNNHGPSVFEKLKRQIIELKNENKYLPAPEFNIIRRLHKVRHIKWRLRYSRKHVLMRRLLTEAIVKPIRRKAVGRLYSPPSRKEKYIFYPMHAPIEDQVIVRGFPFRNEFELIKTVALSLPSGYRLYVKEHPGYEGFYPYREFKSLAEYPQVRIVPACVNSHDLINHADLIIVINSTVWLESLLMSKPVIALGKGFFNGFGVCREVWDLDRLDAEICEAIQSPFDIDRVQRYVHALYEVSYPIAFRYYLTQSPARTGQIIGRFILHLINS